MWKGSREGMFVAGGSSQASSPRWSTEGFTPLTAASDRDEGQGDASAAVLASELVSAICLVLNRQDADKEKD